MSLSAISSTKSAELPWSLLCRCNGAITLTAREDTHLGGAIEAIENQQKQRREEEEDFRNEEVQGKPETLRVDK